MAAKARQTKVSKYRASKRKKSPENIGEFGMQDLKDIGRKISEAGRSIKEKIIPDKQRAFKEQKAEAESAVEAAPVDREYAEKKLQEQPAESTKREGYRERVERERKEREERHKKILEEHGYQPTQPDRESRSEMLERKRTEREAAREERRRKWAESPENANNRGKIEETPKERESAEPEPEPTTEELKGEDSDVDGVQKKVRLYKSGKYRVDEEGWLYRPSDTPGKWVKTSQKTKFEIPKDVDDTAEAQDKGTKKRREREEPTEPSSPLSREESKRETRGDGRSRDIPDFKPATSSGILSKSKPYDEDAERRRLASFEKSGSALSAGTGYLYAGSGKLATGSGYDVDSERRRLASFEKQGSSLRVGSGYIMGGSYRGSGYDPEKEAKRLAEIEAAGSPLSAGLSYLSAGKYKSPKPQPEVGKLDIKTSDVYSSGKYNFGYGGKKKEVVQPIPVEQSVDTEMARLAAMQTRQAQLTQLQQIQAMQKAIQPQLEEAEKRQVISQPIQVEEPQKPASAVEAMFGVKTTVKPSQQSNGPGSATAQLFGLTTSGKKPPKNASGNVINEFFGLKYGYGVGQETAKSKPKEQPVTAIGEFGGHKIKHTNTDVKVYTPKNNLPETKGGFFGLFENATKTKQTKGKTKNQQFLQKKVRPTASEFLFGKKQ